MSPHEFRLILFSVALLLATVFLSSCEKPKSPYSTSAKIDEKGCLVEIYQKDIMDPLGSASAYCNWLAGVDVEAEMGFMTGNCQAISGSGFYRATVLCGWPSSGKWAPRKTRELYLGCQEDPNE